jgi:spermidine synthase
MAGQRIEIRTHGEGFAFYLDGCLQFSTKDELYYHESIVHSGAAIVNARLSGAWNALILGGGDGLAARELLKWPLCGAIRLVDFDPGVLELGRTDFSGISNGALLDERVSISIGDAVDFIKTNSGPYDVIIADFTFPDSEAGARLFTASFLSAIKSALSPRGVFVTNCFSPIKSAPAFWSLFKTLESCGFHSKPLRLPLPSFIEQGYGEWGFFISSGMPIAPDEFTRWDTPFTPLYLTRPKLRENLIFPLSSVVLGYTNGRTIVDPADLLCILKYPLSHSVFGDDNVDFTAQIDVKGLVSKGIDPEMALSAFDTEWLHDAFAMLKKINIERLLREIETRIMKISRQLHEEFIRFKSELPNIVRAGIPTAETLSRFLYIIIIVLMIINLTYPDAAFAKGGYYGGGNYGGNYGDGAPIQCLNAPAAPTPFHGIALQAAAMPLCVDMKGRGFEKPHILKETADGEENLFYLLTDDLLCTPEGAVYMRLPVASYFFRFEPAALVLVRERSRAPLLRLKADPDIFQGILVNVSAQLKVLDKTIRDYRTWISWTNPMTVIEPGAKAELTELKNLEIIRTALASVMATYENHPAPASPAWTGGTRLASGVYVDARRSIAVNTEDSRWKTYIFDESPAIPDLPVLAGSDELSEFFRHIIAKMLPASPGENSAETAAKPAATGSF